MENTTMLSTRKVSAKPSEIVLLDEVSDIRKVWPKEAQDFTPWLSSKALSALGEVLGLTIDDAKVDTEVKTNQSDRRCDIVAWVNEGEEKSKIIIENQIEKTDIGHLGRLILYAATNGAKYAVWVVSDVEPDFETTIAWLNEHTTTSLYFFLVQVGAYQLKKDDNGEDKVGVRFYLVEGPNNIEKAKTSGTPKQKKNIEFWSGFRTYLDAIDPDKISFRATQQPSIAWEYYIHIGTSRCSIKLLYTQQGARILIWTHGRQNDAFKQINNHLSEIISLIRIAKDKVIISDGDKEYPYIRFENPIGSKAKNIENYQWLYECLNKIIPFVQKILNVK